MLTHEQLAIRRTMVTASDTYVLAGEGYSNQSPLGVYLSKVSEEPPWEGNVYSQIGNMLEPMVMSMLAEQRGIQVAEATTERSEIIPWLGATPDRMVLDSQGRRIAVAEGKVVLNPKSAAYWGELPADRVVIQTTIQMIVTRTRRAFVPALILGDFRVWELELDDRDLAPALLEMDEAFWKNHVLPRIPPDPDGTEASARALKQLYPKVKGGIVRAGPAAEQYAREYFSAQRDAAVVEERLLAAENAIKAAIGDAGGIEGDGWCAVWSPRKGSISWKQAIKTLLPGTPPEIFEQFRGEESRQFMCKPLKGKRE